MFYTVDETAYILGCKRHWLYYHLRMSNIPSLKVLDSWRIPEEGLEVAYRLFNLYRFGEPTNDLGLSGLAERVATVRQKYAADPARSAFKCIQSRRRRLVCSKARSITLARTLPGQLMLFEEFAS